MSACTALAIAVVAGIGRASLWPCAAIFMQPLKLPAGATLWMLLPLLGCVAVVYRATRVQSPRHMPKGTVLTFINILVGMFLVAAAFYLVHMLVVRYM